MKKRTAFCLLLISGIIFTAACGTKDKLYKDMENAISELRTNYFYSSSEFMNITIITGKREEPFSVDGKKEQLVEFSVITIKPVNDIDTEYTYSIDDGGNIMTGILDLHPFGGQYIADSGKEIKSGVVTVTVTNSSGREETVTLNAFCSSEMIGYKEALRLFVNSAEGRIRTFYSDKAFLCEVYIRFLPDPVEDSDSLYWYVAVTNGEQTFAALIDVLSGQIVAEI